MAASIREQILARLLALLINANGCAANVFRSRQEPLARNLAPATEIEPTLENSKAESEWSDLNNLQVEIRITVRGDVYDNLADPIAVTTHALIMNDSALSGLCDRVRRISTQWQAQEADQSAGVLTMHYQFIYLSAAGDLTQRAIA